MQIKDQQITKFQVLYKRHFGVDISKKDALARGIKIVRFVEIILKNKDKTNLTPTLK